MYTGGNGAIPAIAKSKTVLFNVKGRKITMLTSSRVCQNSEVGSVTGTAILDRMLGSQELASGLVV